MCRVPGEKANLLDVNFASRNWYLFVATKTVRLCRIIFLSLKNRRKMQIAKNFLLSCPPIYFEYWIYTVTFGVTRYAQNKKMFIKKKKTQMLLIYYYFNS